MRFFKETFQLPNNLEQQFERHVAPIQTLLGSLALSTSSILVAQLAGIKALAAANTAAIVGVVLILAGLIAAVQFAKQKKVLRNILPIALALPLFAIVVAYKNGYLPFTTALPVTLLTLLAYRGRFRLIVPYLFIAAWAIAEHFSPVQAAEPYVLRLIILNAVLIYPIHLLLEAEEWNEKLLSRVFQKVLILGILVSLFLTFIRMVVEQQGVATTAIGSVTVFSALYFTISRGWLSGARVKLIFSLALLGIYWFMVAKNGIQPTMFIVAFALLYFLLLPSFDALMLSVALLVVSLLGIYNSPLIDFELTPFVSRHVVASLISMVVLYSLFKQREMAHSLSFSAIVKALPISIGITLGVVLLELPVFETISFNSAINETQVRLLVGLSTMFVLITWITSRYWHNHQSLQNTLTDLSVTERELDSSLRQTQKQRQQAEQAARALELEQDRQKQMFAVISHEIRTPAASLNMLIKNKGVTAQDPSDAEKMTEISDHLVSVLNDLRFVIKPEQAKVADETAVKLFITIDKIASSLSVLLEQKGQVIKTVSEGRLPDVLQFNVQVIRQIVTNLVKNASIHSGATEIVLRVGANQQDDQQWAVAIAVEDNGRGIAASDQQKLFKAFSRGSTNADGTGLGLYIAREYANQLGGDLQYRLRDGGGSVFELCFVAKQARLIEASEDNTELSATIAGKQILVAEDNKTIQMVTQIILQKAGATVVLADDGAEALALVQESLTRFDLVLTDIMMPNMNGYELTHQLRALGFTKPIIGVTAAVIGEESAQLLKMGADQVIEKPMDLSKLNAIYAACVQSADDEGSAKQGV